MLRGQFKGKEGKVNRVSQKYQKIYIDKLEITKKDGSKAFVPVHPSNVMITEVAEDKKRIKGAK